MFTESQTQQFNESQKKFIELWENSQKQLLESQKKLVYAWVDSLRSGTVQVDYSENLENSQNLQHEMINSALANQQVALNLALETQKQFWDNYFQATQKIARQTVNS